jgi:ATP-dependent Lon protease
MRDEAEIRGHRRTYIGAMPGRIIQAVKRTGVKNPVFMLDEVDKLGASWRGDPSSALLEVLDPQQNHAFRDHYLDVDFDLSQVLFICTANTTSPIPAPLLDRMETIQIDGYTEYDKLHIAKRYLVPRQMRVNGVKKGEIEFTEPGLRKIIRDYTREAGVRQLERQIGKACRKVATKIAEGDLEDTLEITKENANEYLGKPRYRFEAALRTERPGVATGLAWTPTGGEVLFVESAIMPGKEDKLILTGKLGEVMQESARIALSYVESHAEMLGIADRMKKGKIHLHVPSGAVPKDGPSAGITLVTSLVSLLSGRSVRSDIAMTGEITLQGQVLPIGGVKLKVMAAHRTGIKKVLLPKLNEIDIEEIPEQVREDIELILVEDINEVLEHALEPVETEREAAQLGAEDTETPVLVGEN